jgi:hypothetical protein
MLLLLCGPFISKTSFIFPIFSYKNELSFCKSTIILALFYISYKLIIIFSHLIAYILIFFFDPLYFNLKILLHLKLLFLHEELKLIESMHHLLISIIVSHSQRVVLNHLLFQLFSNVLRILIFFHFLLKMLQLLL